MELPDPAVELVHCLFGRLAATEAVMSAFLRALQNTDSALPLRVLQSLDAPAQLKREDLQPPQVECFESNLAQWKTAIAIAGQPPMPPNAH